MPVNPNLVPTVITDVNGVTKTVHRKPTVNGNLGRALPAPVVNKVSVPKKTPLNLPARLTDDEVKAFANALGMLPYGWDREAREIRDWVSPEGIAIMKESLANRSLDTDQAKTIIRYARSTGANRYDTQRMLLVVSRCTREGLVFEPLDNAHFQLLTTIFSLPYNEGKHGGWNGPFKTEEELDAATAIATFVMRRIKTLGKPDSTLKTVRVSRPGSRPTMELIVISNKHLDAVIRERPQDLEKISSYIDRVGMHPTHKRPVKHLQEFLDDDTSEVLDEGWL